MLASNIARGPREDTPRARNLRTFVRTYPEGPLFGHAVGYSYLRNGRRGLEQSENRPLAGEENEFQSIFSQLRSQDREGRDVVTTLDPGGQKAGAERARGQEGRDRGAGAADRARSGDGQHPHLRPEPDSRPSSGA